MAPSSQHLEPPEKPGRFRLRLMVVRASAAIPLNRGIV
jgi:hypothetical protein